MNMHEAPFVAPKTVAIIMDGNRRYEKKMGLKNGAGHRAGRANARIIGQAAKALGAEQFTVWAGSRSNLGNRPAERGTFFELLRGDLQRRMRQDDKVRFRLCGKFDEFTEDKTIPELARYVEQKTAKYAGRDLTVLFGYSGKDEIVEMVRSIVASGVSAEEVNEAMVQKHLWTSHLRDVELLIRTGVRTDADPEGDEHWSDPFLPWQINNTRIIWSRKLWPEFTEQDLYDAFARFALCRPKQLMGA